MSTTQLTTNAAVIEVFRKNGGFVPTPYGDDDPPPMVILHTVGRKSGNLHLVPMRAMLVGEGLYVFGSAHGKARHPDWYLNLIAQPEIDLEIGTGIRRVRATEVHGEERDTIFARHAARFPIFAEYARTLERTIPVIRLDRRPE